MSDFDHEHDTTDIDLRQTGSSNNDWSEVQSVEEPAANPIKVVFDNLHGRWVWALVMCAILAPALALAGYWLGPVQYDSSSILSVESRLRHLVEETQETQQIAVDEEVQEQKMYIRQPSVLLQAFDNPKLVGYANSVQRTDYRNAIASGLDVNTPRGSAVIVVSLTDSDKMFAAIAVNAVVDAYFDLFQSDSKTQHQDTLNKISGRLSLVSQSLKRLKREQIDLLEDSKYAITDLAAIRSSNVENMMRIEDKVSRIDDAIESIRSRVEKQARQTAESEDREPTEEELAPNGSTRLQPSQEDLDMVDPSLTASTQRLGQLRIQYSLAENRFGKKHRQYRVVKSELDAQERSHEIRMKEAEDRWNAEMSDTRTWDALQNERAKYVAQLADLKAQNQALGKSEIASEDLETQIRAQEEEMQLLQDRKQGLEREQFSIRQGRVRIAQPAAPAMLPSRDRKFYGSVAGAALGFAISFGSFFLLGTLDKKTFGVRQLEDSANRLRILGVMPNMDDPDDDADTVIVATDCVHRIRGRIEARRSPERGFALMVSSPFQGDGKTTLAVSLGWSYAESGYKVLLLDADFIGRAMTHQFGHLKDGGLREIIRNGGVGDEIHELGHPNLSLLGVGYDRRISAANLSPRLMGRVLDAVRDEYDIIILDSGPMTASVEALPIASAVDGVILALKRGRSRGRLGECIRDIQSVGADYLGVVLNYADRGDCMRHGSTSRMSLAVETALAGGDGEALPPSKNPLLGSLSDDRKEIS